MATKVVADPDTRIITVIEAPVAGFQTLDVVSDIFSPLKVDWLTTPALHRVKFPLRHQIGEQTGSGQIGPYVFLANDEGWRMQPYDIDHVLTILGNLRGEAAVLGLSGYPIWIARPGRTIVTNNELSAQALTRETGVSGLTSEESTALLTINANLATITGDITSIEASISSIEGDIATVETNIGTITTDLATAVKIVKNKSILDPVTGILTIYEDNGVDVFLSAPVYESADTSQPYRGQGVQRQEQLT